MKIKTSQIPELRAKYLKKQKGLCAICKTKVTEQEAVLDHCHTLGNVRGVLHRSCNQVEGRILSWVKRSRAVDYLSFLKGLVAYLEEDHSSKPIHSEHKTPVEKEIQKLKRLMRRVKRPSTKAKYKAKIEELQYDQSLSDT